ncbi:hypothetical protein [Hyphomicrobium sp. CS1BSMeth3]|uniref:hypothetical protein n=1 Tax=Hyphomicrobium sp. CS1BSMeth3 TaxID=1892844 RepID=UPI001160C4AD|nr:hypothetical protein [Hyphomicrobium sp. CS1BSMeth3]
MLAHRWPLLTDNQNPESPEALLAYHLHRLHITDRTIAHENRIPRSLFRDIRHAKLQLSSTDIAKLAKILHIDMLELTRPLTADELERWHFYRQSARHPREVWRNAHKAWKQAGLTTQQAAKIMAVPTHTPRNALNDRRKPEAMTFAAALRLTTALNLSSGPQTLLPQNTPKPKGPHLPSSR